MHRTVYKFRQEWHPQINPTLWAYRTSIRMPIGATPFALVYGVEAMLPIEVEIPSLRVSLRGLITDDENRISRLQELELLDEHRQVAFNHL